MGLQERYLQELRDQGDLTLKEFCLDINVGTATARRLIDAGEVDAYQLPATLSDADIAENAARIREAKKTGKRVGKLKGHRSWRVTRESVNEFKRRHMSRTKLVRETRPPSTLFD